MKYLKKLVIHFFLNLEHIVFYKKFESFLKKSSAHNRDKLLKLHRDAFEDLKEFVKKYFSLNNFNDQFYFDLTLKTQTVDKGQKLSFIHGYLLQEELRKYLLFNKSETNINILEIGTARGYSSICMAKVLNEQNMNGKIITVDILPVDKKIYWNSISDIESGKQTRYELLKPWEHLVNKYIIYIKGYTKIALTKIFLPRINFCFIDGSHEYDDVKYEIQFVSSRQKQNDIIFFDDYNKKKFPGVVQAIDKNLGIDQYEINLLDYGEDRKYLLAIKK